MNATFEQLVADQQTTVQGTHWAALINAWGCVRKDLDKAVQVFESIQSHPSTVRSHAKLPDAVVYEAMINVLVTLRRADLLPTYITKMASHGLHMTAYIANLLIKGYAASGDIERSREIFESLSDPPEGVAAPNNHAPHDSEAATPNVVPAGAPVYREVRVWLLELDSDADRYILAVNMGSHGSRGTRQRQSCTSSGTIRESTC